MHFIINGNISGNIESVQNLINTMDINGHESESFSGDTALTKASEAGNLLSPILFGGFCVVQCSFF